MILGKVILRLEWKVILGKSDPEENDRGKNDPEIRTEKVIPGEMILGKVILRLELEK